MNAVKSPRKTMSSREFNQNTAGAKRLAEDGPLFITDRSEVTHVLMTRHEYEAKTGERLVDKPNTPGFADRLADPRPEADFEWEPPRLTGDTLRIPDLD